MGKRDGQFLPRFIYRYGGIENLLAGDMSNLRAADKKYRLYYNTSDVRQIIGWVLARYARSGLHSVTEANALILAICNRYSGAPDRSYNAAKIEGLGRAIINEYGDFDASFKFYAGYRAATDALKDAQRERRTHSEIISKKLWAEGADGYRELTPCRWCATPVLIPEKTGPRYQPFRCKAADCRRMDYLSDLPQSRGGIDLTPRQRKETAYEAWDTQRAINYLIFKVKEAKRESRANHDLR